MLEALVLVGFAAMFVAHCRLIARVRMLETRLAETALPEVTRPVPPPEAEPAPESTTHTSFTPARAAEGATSSSPTPPTPQGESEPTAPESPERETLASLFERLVGGRLLVWTGGIAIALAGLFLVRYSIELGLIGPRVRMIAAAVFGAALVAAGEVARRRVPDDLRIGQALVGAGVLVLYAAAYGSHILYGLIGLGAAFILMAAVAAAALALSLRHGTPTAALGLVGGFLTPLLVGRSTGEAAPLLGYLTLLNIAVFAVAVRSARPWLGWAAKLMTLGWTASILVTAPDDVLMIGLFLFVHTVATGMAWRDEPVPSLAPTLALLQIGAVVSALNYAPTGWVLLLSFGAVGFALADRSRAMAALPVRALGVGLLLLAAHRVLAAAHPTAPYAAALTLLFAGGAWWRTERGDGRLGQVAMICAALAGPALLMRTGQPGLLPPGGWGVLFAAVGFAPAALVLRLRAAASRGAPFDRALLLAAVTAVGLLLVGMADLVPARWTSAGWMLVALAAAAAGRRLDDGGVVRLAIFAMGAALLAATLQAGIVWTTLFETLIGVPALTSGLPPVATAMILFAAPGALAFALWRALPLHETELRRVAGIAAGALAGLALYILFKQVFALRTQADFVARGFAERTLLTQGLFFAGWMLLKRPRLPWLAAPALALTAVAAARFVWFDVLMFNPVWVTQNVGAWPLLNLILPNYLGTAFWLFEARRRAGDSRTARIILVAMLVALVAGAGLLVRQLFQGAILTGAEMPRPEFYGYSLAGLLLAVGLLLFGWRRRDIPLRVAGLALLTATVVKVFLIDAAALEGLLRIASFLGLGVALIGMGKLYGTVLGRGGTSSRHPREGGDPEVGKVGEEAGFPRSRE